MLITFEGIDRSGKTTQAKLLAEALGDQALLVREPGGTPAAERIRELVKDPALTVGPLTETLLFCAARADLVATVIRPALTQGKVVVCDRYVDSTVAYQGGARGLGIDEVERLNAWVTGGLDPDVTFLLDVQPAVAGGRGGEPDRFEQEGENLQRAVAAAYEELARRHPDRYVRVDAERPVEEVHAEVIAEVEAPGKGGSVIEDQDPEASLDDALNVTTASGFIDAMVENPRDELVVSGWILVNDESPHVLELVARSGETVLAQRIDRPDVAADHPQAIGAVSSGFTAFLPRPSFQHDDEWNFELRALGQDGEPAFTCPVTRRAGEGAKGPFPLKHGFVYA